MKNNIYSECLEEVNGIRFSRREIDIIASMLSGKSAKGIASFLSIAPRTVETHIRNIMMKVECNSRDGIINFIEKSDKFNHIKQYYSNLLNSTAFEKYLKEISNFPNDECRVCLIVDCKLQENKRDLLHQIKNHLTLAGIKSSIELREQQESTHNLLHGSSRGSHKIYVTPEKLNNVETDKENTKETDQKQLETLFLCHEKKEGIENSKDAGSINCIDFTISENYYLSFFELLKNIFSPIDLNPIVKAFMEQGGLTQISTLPSSSLPLSEINNVEEIKGSLNPERKAYIQWKSWPLISALLFIGIIGLSFFTFYWKVDKEKLKNPIVLSELTVPVEPLFLEQSELLLDIDKNFNGKEEIQTIALVGIGGAGKTTLARQYARQQQSNVIWEINAERQESLHGSFEKLAQHLAKTKEDEKVLRGIQGIKNPTEREEKTIAFVQKRLRSQPNWFLIYDNVEHFADIQKYFPQDNKFWGRGKVILTTRNANIENNRQVNHSIFIGELSEKQKLNLFTKIMEHGSPHPITSKKAEIIMFLESIPSFFLDISVAAYYLKATNIPYGKYLENLENYNNEFASVQENLLKEAGSYIKTRYGIIIQSLELLKKSHKDFGELLLFISLLDSQTIPRDLLNKHRSDVVVDNFIYHLKKYSLITPETSGSTPNSNFSIHRSTQKIMLAYLTNMLKLEKNQHFLQSIAKTLEDYTMNAVDEDDYAKMNSLAIHCKMFLDHADVLTNCIQEYIGGKFGILVYRLGNYIEAKKILEKSLINLNRDDKKSYHRIALILEYLGNVHKYLGNYKKANSLLEQSLAMYQRVPENYQRIAEVLLGLGNVNNRLGNYEQAKNLFKQSLAIYKNHFPEDHFYIAWASTHLGMIYRVLGYNEEAKKLFQRSFVIYKKHFGDTHIKTAWVLSHMGSLHNDLGNYEQAKNMIEYSLTIYKRDFPETDVNVARIIASLGSVYANLGNYEQAKRLLENSLITQDNNFGKDNVLSAEVLRDLGQVYFLEGQTNTAAQLVNKAFSVLQQNNNSRSYVCLEILSDLYNSKYIQERDRADAQRSLIYKNKSLNYLENALKIVRIHFSVDSPHIGRIQSKIKKLQKESCFNP